MERKIGSGAFGEIYGGSNIESGEQVAVKLESIKSKQPQLLYEAKLYRILQGGLGVPNIHWYGQQDDYNVMVMELLGASLEDMFVSCKRQFSLKTIVMLADQIINRIEYVHTHDFLHRDIKPDNFLMGVGKKANQVQIIDFGLAKKYRRAPGRQHIAYRDGKNLTGTARYASLNTHRGIEQSRRDDLESAGYVFMYFVRGSLPWQGLPKADGKKARHEAIMAKKKETSIALLCKGFPSEFASYLEYCRSLQFEDRPDYAHLRRLLKELFYREGYQYDFAFDWVLLNNQAEEESELKRSQQEQPT